jgi:hypothetical protein
MWPFSFHRRRPLSGDTVEKLGWLAFLGFTDEFPIKSVMLSD